MNISYPMKTRPLAGMTMVALLMCLTACTAVDEQAKQQAATRKARQETAMRLWKERCETKAGEKIYKTVDHVDGIFLLKLRSDKINYDDQFALDDPYGSDLLSEGYIRSFLKGGDTDRRDPLDDLTHLPNGYRFVEAKDARDGLMYRYTGRIEEPWLTDKKYLKGYTKFVLDKVLVKSATARYGITYEDISTLVEREYWIAGSSLRVIDLLSNEVIAERTGYMVDWAQGSREGGRSPWLFAADNACPAFASHHGAFAQARQADRFLEKVLKPSK